MEKINIEIKNKLNIKTLIKEEAPEDSLYITWVDSIFESENTILLN